MKKKVFIFTSVHQWNDTRIFYKEAVSLAKKYEVELHAPADFDFKEESGVKIIGLPKWVKRLDRRRIRKELWKRVLKSDADIFHFHDPELIPLGLNLKKLGAKVIFDIHENIAEQIKEKEYLPKLIRYIISIAYKTYEKKMLHKFTGLILAEDSYRKYYGSLNKNFKVILNMPDINCLSKYYSENRNRNELFYIGGVSHNRGLDVTIEALKYLTEFFPDIFMHYVGPYTNQTLDTIDVKSINKHIKFYGRMSLFEGFKYSINAKVGISILKPIDNYIKSYSTKVFEYMAVGLPIVTSNFKLYKNIIEKNNCGICVDPLKPKEIADAIAYLINNPSVAIQMGKNGRKAVEEKYNWKEEEKKLFSLYEDLLT